MVKVLHVITGLGRGGAERSLFNLATARLEGLQHEVVSLGGLDIYGPELQKHGIPVQALGMATMGDVLRAFWKLRKAVRASAPDILQGWMYHGNLAASLAAGPGFPVVWNIRQSLPDIHLEKWGTRAVIHLGRAVSARVDRVIYNSSLARQQHEAFGFASAQGMLVLNGFDIDLWRPDEVARDKIRAELNIPEGALVLGYVGRGHPVKDIPMLLKSLPQLMAKHPALHVVMVGDGTGPDASDLAPLHTGLPQHRVHYLGDRSDIPALMTSFDLFCICSRAEAFPNVLGEAMATALPCVSTSVGDCPLMLGEAGRLVPPGDPGALGRALDDLLTLPEPDRAALGRAARARIKNRFAIEDTLRLYAAIYMDLT
jgi:glycosyltransferase involved in cell wall biosynthesis